MTEHSGFTSEEATRIQAMYKELELSPTELDIFLARAKKAQLDPVAGHIIPQIRKQKDDDGNWKRKLSIVTSIDALRLIADRTNNYAPGKDSEFGPPDQLFKPAPEWSKSHIKKFAGGVWHEYSGIAYFREYVQLTRAQKVAYMWEKMPNGQLEKCAEAKALRRGFPNELQGLYSFEEMGQADNTEPEGNRFGEPPRIESVTSAFNPKDVDRMISDLVASPKPPHKSTAFPFGANVSDPPPNPDASSPQPPIQPSPGEIGPAGQENSEVPKSPKIAKKISPAKRGVLFAAVRESTRPDWTGRDEKTRQAELKKVLLTLRTDEYPDGITSSLQIPDVSFDLILAWVKTGTFGALRAVVGQ